MKTGKTAFDPTRRRLLRGTATVFAAGIGAGLLPDTAQAAKVSKAAMLYQTHPHGSASCANCVHFEPGPSPSAMGACTVVAGSISPRGYCIAYSPRA